MLKKSLISLSVLLSVTGCSNLPSFGAMSSLYPKMENTTRLCLSPKGVYHKCGGSPQKSSSRKKQAPLFADDTAPSTSTNTNMIGVKHHKKLEEYIEQMVMDMQASLQTLDVSYPIAVASFVELDTDLNLTNQLGMELSESFLAEMGKVGFPLAEHRATGEIHMTLDGDFVLSRDPHKVKNSQRIGYVLSGTMIKRYNGVQVNARVVGLKSNVILASSSKFLPRLILTGY